MRLEVLLALALILVLAASTGCTVGPNDKAPGEGTFHLLVSDQPSALDEFGSLSVTLSDTRVFSANEDGENGNETGEDAGEEGFREFELDGITVDLTRLKGARATRVLNTTLEAGNYTKVELHVSEVEGVVDNETVDVKVPSEKLMITRNFEVRPNATTRFVFDVQVVEKGTGGYNLIPVISESGVAGEDVEVEEVEPGEAVPEGVGPNAARR